MNVDSININVDNKEINLSIWTDCAASALEVALDIIRMLRDINKANESVSMSDEIDG